MTITNPNYYWKISKDRKTVSIISKKTKKVVQKEDADELIDYAFRHSSYDNSPW